jgi:RNA polymerase sigma-70 factor (ECF subfamily)
LAFQRRGSFQLAAGVRCRSACGPQEVIAVFEDRADPKPSYIMWLEWRDGRISFIRDYRYVRYVTADAELTLAPEANPADDGVAQ